MIDTKSTIQKVWFSEEKRPYTVQAYNEKFAVCTKPFFKTVLYCIIDWEKNIRGPENLVFGAGAETEEQCQEMLERVTSGETEISHRRKADLHIKKLLFSDTIYLAPSNQRIEQARLLMKE